VFAIQSPLLLMLLLLLLLLLPRPGAADSCTVSNAVTCNSTNICAVVQAYLTCVVTDSELCSRYSFACQQVAAVCPGLQAKCGCDCNIARPCSRSSIACTPPESAPQNPSTDTLLADLLIVGAVFMVLPVCLGLVCLWAVVRIVRGPTSRWDAQPVWVQQQQQQQQQHGPQTWAAPPTYGYPPAQQVQQVQSYGTCAPAAPLSPA